MSDKIIRCLAYNGRVSVICANTTTLSEKARKTHDFSPVVASAFSRVLTISAIMGIEMKGQKDKLTIQVKGNGPIGMMCTITNNNPIIKGYVTNPQVDIPVNNYGKLDIETAVGKEGYINVIKDIGLKKPYIGISTLSSGEIADDFARFFKNSEQRDSAVGLGVLLNKEGIKSSGGFLISPMPDATKEDIEKIEKSIFEAGAISKMLDKKLTLKEIAIKITGDKNIQILEENIEAKYECDCSKEHMQSALIAIGKEEIQNIINEDEKAELVCHFCNKKYKFSKEELEDILEYYNNKKDEIR